MKRENQLVSGGGLLFLFGLLAFVPPLMDRQLMILSWLGSMSQPVGLSAMVVGGVLWGLGRLQLLREAPPPGITSPTEFASPTDAIAPPTAPPATQPAPAAPDAPPQDDPPAP